MRDRLLLQVKRLHVNFNDVNFLDGQDFAGAVAIFDAVWKHEARCLSEIAPVYFVEWLAILIQNIRPYQRSSVTVDVQVP